MSFFNKFLKRFNFVNINKLNDLPVGTQIDVMGIVKDPGMHQEVNVKNSNVPKPRKNIQIFDETLSGIEIVILIKFTLFFKYLNNSFYASFLLLITN